MKKTILTLILLMFASVASADTYSNIKLGMGFGNENVCAGGFFCVDNNSNPQLNTDKGYYFYVVPVAVRKPIQGNLGVRLESEFSASKREFDLSKSRGEYNLRVDGVDNRYSFGGNALVDYKMAYAWDITPYAGMGAGIEYSKLSADFKSNGRSMQGATHDDFRRYWKYIVGVEVPIIGNVKGNVEYNFRQTDRFQDNDSMMNWRLNDEHIVNAGLIVYWD